MYCYNCGNQIPDGSRFCMRCGASLTGTSPAPQNVSKPVCQAPVQNVQSPRLYMTPEGVTLMNYKFTLRDAAGNVRYTAATVTEKMMGYTLRTWYPNGAEAFMIQSKGVTVMNLQFEMVKNGRSVTLIQQKNRVVRYDYELPQLGMVATGDFISHQFDITQNGQNVAHIRRKLMSWGDSYEIDILNQQLEEPILAAVFAVEFSVIDSRRRRRR